MRDLPPCPCCGEALAPVRSDAGVILAICPGCRRAITITRAGHIGHVGEPQTPEAP